MKFFERKGGYDNTAEDYNQAGYLYSDYIAVQRAIAQREGIPFFDQFSLLPVDEDNFHRYYLSDHLHLNAHGYTNITYHQVEFMATH